MPRTWRQRSFRIFCDETFPCEWNLSVPHLLLDPLGPLVQPWESPQGPHFQSCYMCKVHIINIANVTDLERLSRCAYPLFYPPLPSTPISPCCRDEFLLRPAVHVITVVTARWSVIHFSDLCIPITKWRLLSRLYVCPARAPCRMIRWDEASEVTRVSAPQDRITLPSLCLLFGPSACFWLSVRHVDTILFIVCWSGG